MSNQKPGPTTYKNQTKPRLFSYGTLQDPEIQKVLFGFCCTYKKARLSGWSLYSSQEEGYLFIKPDPTGTVSGRVLDIDTAALNMADRWEEVPLYMREKVMVTVEDGTRQEAWAYTRRDAGGELHCGKELSLLDRQLVLSAAANLKKQTER